MAALSPSFVFLLCASFCASIGAMTDLQTRRIPNVLTGTSVAVGLLLHLTANGWKSMALAAAAGLVGGAIFFAFFVIGGMGAGDIKLMAAVSTLAGFGHLSEIFVATVLAGGIFACVLAVSRGRLKSTLVNVGSLARHHAAAGLLPHPDLNLLNSKTLRLPYAVAIAAGCWVTVLGQIALR
ncbi:MAG: A24 family peptidase [Acidobacteriaceae bacterium]